MVSLLIAVVVAAVVFDYINGFHDAANAIATVVSTGVLPLRTAVIIAAIFNFVGATTGTAVATTIATGFADAEIVDQTVVLSALLGASAWNLITWWYGIPSSSSHALIGGLAGAVVAHAGAGAFHWATLVKKVLVPLVVSPTLGFVAAFFLMVALLWVVRRARPGTVHRASRRLQLVSACMMAFSHGSNDAQKAMGIITLALVAFVANGGAGVPEWMMPVGDEVPRWVIYTCATAIALGTAAGGRRIIKTMGTKIIRISPLQGFAAETAGAATILVASHAGVPVSTTHVINACIMGVGASNRISAVRWGVATNIVIAWVLTLPLSAAMAFVIELVISRLLA
ncbi:inorganic phosphate transporter [Sandaracinus amylolyticus]|uniref:Putative low-affinity inorganic phosphate transporter n=1 Tax=Sandaracinus amylolyticus TaxID=927083 RepID=A0A0F6W721_9BACT|nr:inorganic phosphate transporter [Sandaracinus amylolyticus]AKF08921.1 Putative low-affinity inorganic phosphate transporter [Sandaracinus amylolyticus]